MRSTVAWVMCHSHALHQTVSLRKAPVGRLRNMDEKDSMLRQPIGEVLRKQLSADFLKKEIAVPGFLKKEIPGGILDKDVLFWRKQAKQAEEAEDIEQAECFACGKETPATVSTCMHCGAHIEVSYERDNYLDGLTSIEAQGHPDPQSRTLLDLTDEIL